MEQKEDKDELKRKQIAAKPRMNQKKKKRDICAKCKKVSPEGPEEAPVQWIQGSACKFWLHYKCSGTSVPYHLVDKSIIYCDICDSV